MNLKRWTVSSLFERALFFSAAASVGASAVQRSPPETRALFERRAVLMVTYDELFLLLSLIVSIIALVYNITKKK